MLYPPFKFTGALLYSSTYLFKTHSTLPSFVDVLYKYPPSQAAYATSFFQSYATSNICADAYLGFGINSVLFTFFQVFPSS